MRTQSSNLTNLAAALRFDTFAILRLGPLSNKEIEKFLDSYLPDKTFTLEEKQEVIKFASSNPLALKLVTSYARTAKDSGQQLFQFLSRAREELFRHDPTLVLMTLRKELATRLREIAKIRGIHFSKMPGLIQLGQLLKRNGALTAEQFSLLYELTTILNRAAHSELVDASVGDTSWQ